MSLDFNVLLKILKKSSSLPNAKLAGYLYTDKANISKHLNGSVQSWRTGGESAKKFWKNAFLSCKKDSFGGNEQDFYDKICRVWVDCTNQDFSPYQEEYSKNGFDCFLDTLIHQAWIGERNKNKNNYPVIEVSEKKRAEAIQAYADAWTSIYRLFLRDDLIGLTPYFFGDKERNLLPKSKDLDLGLAMSLRLRDGIQYSQGLLYFIPEEKREFHTKNKEKIMSSLLTRTSQAFYKFDWEAHTHDIINGDEISVSNIVLYGKYWTDMGEVFLSKNTAHLRTYFFERCDEIPEGIDYERALIIAKMYKNAMKFSEELLETIPYEYKLSYLKFKEHMNAVEIIKALGDDY